MRGLKYVIRVILDIHFWSHPSRMRGLKLKQEENQILTGHIASLVDAWIKIPILFLYRHCHAIASLVDAWIKIMLLLN